MCFSFSFFFLVQNASGKESECMQVGASKSNNQPRMTECDGEDEWANQHNKSEWNEHGVKFIVGERNQAKSCPDTPNRINIWITNSGEQKKKKKKKVSQSNKCVFFFSLFMSMYSVLSFYLSFSSIANRNFDVFFAHLCVCVWACVDVVCLFRLFVSFMSVFVLN